MGEAAQPGMWWRVSVLIPGLVGDARADERAKSGGRCSRRQSRVQSDVGGREQVGSGDGEGAESSGKRRRGEISISE